MYGKLFALEGDFLGLVTCGVHYIVVHPGADGVIRNHGSQFLAFHLPDWCMTHIVEHNSISR